MEKVGFVVIKELDDYQEKAKRTSNQQVEALYKLANFGMGLAGESGEVCDYLKKVVFHGHDLDQDKLADELGDVLWYLANLADAIDLPLSEIARRNVEKLQKRYPEGFDSQRSRERQI